MVLLYYLNYYPCITCVNLGTFPIILEYPVCLDNGCDTSFQICIHSPYC